MSTGRHQLQHSPLAANMGPRSVHSVCIRHNPGIVHSVPKGCSWVFMWTETRLMAGGRGCSGTEPL